MKFLKREALLIVGLGNPGREYKATRHNIGFMVVERLAEKTGFLLSKESRFNARVGKGLVDGVTLHLLLPETYMNLSGEAVIRYLGYYGLHPSQIVVVTDDVYLPFGELRLRSVGSAGGHNGLKSLESLLATREYPRLRIGVGKPADSRDLVDYVLGRFTESEQIELDKLIDRSVDVLEKILKQGLTPVIQAVNTPPKQPKEKPKLLEEEIDLTKPPLEG